jgi:hypothetical protein
MRAMSSGTVREWRVGDMVGRRGTVVFGFVFGIDGDSIIAAGVVVIVCVHCGDLGGDAFVIEGSQWGYVA